LKMPIRPVMKGYEFIVSDFSGSVLRALCSQAFRASIVMARKR
jgi:hypothetical protein